MKFQSHQAIWSYHCGIVNLNPSLDLSLLHTSNDGRFILAKLTLPSHEEFPTLYVLNLYAPAQNSSQERTNFFNSLIAFLLATEGISDMLPHMLIGGDFNFSFDFALEHHTHRSFFPHNLVEFVGSHFLDCLNDPSNTSRSFVPTFQGPDGTGSCIDYFLAGHRLHPLCNDGNTHYLNRRWTDHALLQIALSFGLSSLGKGLWRGTPCWSSSLISWTS
ncbi:hypothetical protein A0J61_10068 [Choanephora cucurbitarum]|uniref:Endonuclease/exonuclease/phosphatase domain-containing protein n=1 Tax=Choanephora cucurbitarum TaxID=101091 RepID=A0A1C7MYC3_9FUNG|nr:hypothetical protein A0J61_10068 [Choanephora cucurbitarum]